MIKVLEKDYLEDSYIKNQFIQNLKLEEKINFSKNSIYYFGNYKKDKLELIKNKILKNKKSLIKAIENNVKIIICGNSYELFNNNFNHKDLNLFTVYNPKMFKKRIKKIKVKKDCNDNSIKRVDSLNKAIDSNNFKYKNLLCVKDPYLIDKIIKKQSKTTLSY